MIDSDISKNSLLPASVFASGPDFLQHPDSVTADDLGNILIAVVVLYQQRIMFQLDSVGFSRYFT